MAHGVKSNAVKGPFIVSLPAPLLKRHPELTKSARSLYQTMMALADGKTGDLRIGARWMKATTIDRAAEMCRDVRLKAMHELQELGLVTAERQRIERVIGGRKRVVLGCVHYKVHPHTQSSKSPISTVDLLQSISSTVEEIDSQSVSNPPPVIQEPHHHPKPEKPDDDDAHFLAKFKHTTDQPTYKRPDLSDHVERTMEKATRLLIREGYDVDVVQEALRLIDERAASLEVVPVTPRYYVASFKNLLLDEPALSEIEQSVRQKKSRREKWMPAFTGSLSAESDQLRQQFNEQVSHKRRTTCE